VKSKGPALIWCPFPDGDSAARVAKTLLDEKLIVCVNIMRGMLSLYEWKGERGEDEEAGALFKTDAALLDRAIARMGELHPYAQPAILGWQCDAASQATAAWLAGLLP
jgi:periplasmic divalent cation tolerance protein